MSTIKLCILGCGGFSAAHAMRMGGKPGVQIVGLCDVNRESAEKYRAAHLAHVTPPPAIFTDPAAMYDATHPDAVMIVTPHTLHFEHGMQAIDRGLHVFMEKPMVTSSPQAHELAAKVEASGKVFVVGYNTPCTPEFDYLRTQIRNNAFGRLELVSGWLTQNWRELTIGLWRQDPKLSGGGQAYDSGAHILNSLCWTVESDIAEVFAFVDNMDTPVDINSSINVRFTNGVLASIVIGGNCKASGSHMSFAFENGRVDIDGWGGSWINVHTPNGAIKYPKIENAKQWPDDNFVDAILGKAKARTSPANGIVQSELMDAIYESARTGMPAKPKR